MRIQKTTQRRNFLRPDRSLCSEWRSDRLLRSEWKQAKKSPTCIRRKISTETPIETKRKALRCGFKRERKGGPFLGLIGRYVASGELA
ncbi:hypothetical protein F2Q69_00022872 [Brassica cretica]|uniref:Uncharacterized protein n=1 Tax=Brassica cretica TaxID=69181 RepID=A0A8S9QQS8_BRACR|nr:hypothetical protein F2Q69_00022872 [Brassica cretica]